MWKATKIIGTALSYQNLVPYHSKSAMKKKNAPFGDLWNKNTNSNNNRHNLLNLEPWEQCNLNTAVFALSSSPLVWFFANN